MKRWNLKAFIKIICVISIICTALSSCGMTDNSGKTADRYSKWTKDINVLKRELPRKHFNAFSKISESHFNSRIEDVKKKIDTLSDSEIKVELAKIIASIGDAHTVFSFDNNRVYPLKLYWFDEGIYVTDTSEQYKSALNLKLSSINGQNIDNIVEKLKAVIPHENEAQLKKAAGNYIVMPEVLDGLGIAGAGSMNATFSDNSGSKLELCIKAEDSKMVKLIGDSRVVGELPLYMKNSNMNYWYQYLEKDNIVYFKYNTCKDMKDKSFKDFNKELFAFIDLKKPAKLIIDLRNNGGGSSPLFDPFLSELAKRNYLNDSNKLFVIIGRQTFSSAIINACQLKERTKATFIGEATGGKPNHYGEVKKMTLPNNNITISYSTKYFKMLDKEMDSLSPDIVVKPSFWDYIKNKDSVMDIIKARP